MATFIMLPNGTAFSEWTGSGGGTAIYADVDDDNGDTQYAYVTGLANGKRLILDMAAPSVAEGDIDMSAGITVQIKASAAKTLSGNSNMIFYQRGTSADSSSISNGYDTITVPASGSYATYSGTAETTSDGSNVWVYGDLAGLQIRADKFRNDRFGELRISYLYAEVDYTPSAAVTHNATFFGANF